MDSTIPCLINNWGQVSKKGPDNILLRVTLSWTGYCFDSCSKSRGKAPTICTVWFVCAFALIFQDLAIFLCFMVQENGKYIVCKFVSCNQATFNESAWTLGIFSTFHLLTFSTI